ncbi:MAG: hypothetical protein ABIT76_15055 [Chthoniobacterales bacterium]
MSLKAFHFLFIIIAIVLSIACSLIGWFAYRSSMEVAALAFGLGFSLLTVVMIFYGVWFLKKSRSIIV